MADQRLQVDSLSPVQLRPATAPIDTYVHPTAGRDLEALARGLSEVSPGIDKFLGVVAERSQDAAYAEGETAARKLFEQGKTIAEATRQGLYPKAANPWYMAGLKEQFGRVAADTWQSDLSGAVATDELMQKTTDLSAFDDFVRQHREQWMKDHVGDQRDPYFEKGFGHRADAYYADERRKFAARLEGRVENQSDDAHFAEVKKHVRDAFLRGVPVEDIALDIDGLNKNAIQNLGRSGTRVNQTTVKAIVAAAIEDTSGQGLKMLNLLKHVQGGAGALGDTGFGSKAYEEAVDKISEGVERNARREWDRDQRERELRTRDTLGTAVDMLVADPHADLSPLIGKLKDNPSAIASLQSLQGAARTINFHTDDKTKDDLFNRIWNANPNSQEAVTEQTVTASMMSGLLTAEDASWLISQMKAVRQASMTKYKDAEDVIFSDFNFRQELSNIKGRFAGPDGIIPRENADKAAHAEAMFREAWWQHSQEYERRVKEDPKFYETPSQKIQFLNDQADIVVRKQLGDALQITPAPPPDFVGARGSAYIQQNAVDAGAPQGRPWISEDTLYKGLHGIMTPELYDRFSKSGVTTTSEQGSFLRWQLDLFKGMHQGQEPQAQPGQQKKE
jgi:hypothetical protein